MGLVATVCPAFGTALSTLRIRLLYQTTTRQNRPARSPGKAGDTTRAIMQPSVSTYLSPSGNPDTYLTTCRQGCRINRRQSRQCKHPNRRLPTSRAPVPVAGRNGRHPTTRIESPSPPTPTRPETPGTTGPGSLCYREDWVRRTANPASNSSTNWRAVRPERPACQRSQRRASSRRLSSVASRPLSLARPSTILR